MEAARIRKRMHACVGFIFALTVVAHVAAQPGTGFTISDGDVYFTQGVSPSGAGGPTGTGAAGANFRVNSSTGTDQVYQSWWWYRVVGVDVREFAFANATGSTFMGNTAVTTWTYPSFTAELTYLVSDNGDNAGRVHQTMRITNTTAAALSIVMSSYTDFDLGATSIGDSASSAGCPQLMRVFEGSTTADLEAWGASTFSVAAFAGVRTALSDADADTFTNTGLPFGVGDFTGAFQWTRMIAPGATSVFEVELRVNSMDPEGACCLPGNICTFMSRACCREMGGTYQGDGVVCDDTLCAPPPPTGACCLNRCDCSIMTRADCETAGGTYRGDATVCGAAACAPRPACPCNWNGDEFLNSQDLFDFLADLFELRADYNCDAAVNSQDFFDFLGCFVSDAGMCP